MVIDFHSHILPAVDDGSKDLSTSIHMIERCMEQGVTHIVATPHFYAMETSVERFLERREEAYEQMKKKLLGKWSQKELPHIYLGAEVAFFRGISRAEHLEDMTIEGTDILLLEMPFAPWTNSDIEEIEWMLRHTKFKIMLAHLERYLRISENKRSIEQLLELPLAVQVNAGSLLDWKQRGKVVKLLKKSDVCVLGSDCHGIHHRPPNLSEGREVMEKKLGHNFLERMDKDGSVLLEDVRGSM